MRALTRGWWFRYGQVEAHSEGRSTITPWLCKPRRGRARDNTHSALVETSTLYLATPIHHHHRLTTCKISDSSEHWQHAALMLSRKVPRQVKSCRTENG